MDEQSRSRFGMRENSIFLWVLILILGAALSWVIVYPAFGLAGVVGLIAIVLFIAVISWVSSLRYVGKPLAVFLLILIFVLAFVAENRGWFDVLRALFERIGG